MQMNGESHRVPCPGLGILPNPRLTQKPIIELRDYFRRSEFRPKWAIVQLNRLPAITLPVQAADVGEKSVSLEARHTGDDHKAAATKIQKPIRAAAVQRPVEQGTLPAAPSPVSPRGAEVSRMFIDESEAMMKKCFAVTSYLANDHFNSLGSERPVLQLKDAPPLPVSGELQPKQTES